MSSLIVASTKHKPRGRVHIEATQKFSLSLSLSEHDM